MKDVIMEKEVNGKRTEKSVPENMASTYEKAGWKLKKEQKLEEKPKNQFSSNINSNSSDK